MAKVKAGFRSKSGSSKKIPATVTLHRTSTRGRGAFEACARFGKSGSWSGTVACSYGKNPRKAIAAAFRALGKHIGSRKGAFAGSR